MIGTGYVGLVTGACLAEMGNQVICLDIDREKVDSLQVGNLPFFEPGLKELVKRNTEANRLRFTDAYIDAIPGSDICFLALPTPSNHDESCDLSYVEAASIQLAEAMDNYLVVVNKSTVPVGTSEKVRQSIQKTLEKRGVQIPFDIVSNPEFLREGSAIEDCMQPDRILLGVHQSRAAKIMQELYAPYHERILIMDIPSAELAKYAANAMLATRLSLINDLASLCEKLGANIHSVRDAIGHDERIGPHYLNPGLGFGGSCLPKDMKALRAIAQTHNHPTDFFDSILEINERQQKDFFEKIRSHFDPLKGITLALWGLSFKPNTDDLREAPSLYLIQKCLEHGIRLRVYDPVAMPKAKLLFNHYPEIHFAQDEYDAAAGADAIALVTEWKQFQFADFQKIGATMRSKILFDGRNQHSGEEMKKFGFSYFCVGKPSQPAMALT